MYWQIKLRYYSIIVSFNYEKINYYYIQMYLEKYIKYVSNVKLSWTPIRTKDEIYPATTRGRWHEW